VRAVRHTGFRGWVDENLPIAITLAVGAYLAVYAFMSTQLVAANDDATTIVSQYRAVVGESPPIAFQPALSFTLVGRRAVVFFNPEQGQTLLLYHEGWLAGQPNAARLEAVPDRALRFFEADYTDVAERTGKMLRVPVRIRVIDVQLGDAKVRGYIAILTGQTQRPALLCLIGSGENLTKMAREMFRKN
jgi:hypothetical protein